MIGRFLLTLLYSGTVFDVHANRKRIEMSSKKIIALIGLFLFMWVAKAQIVSVNIKATGLTCAMCSNTIDKALRSLDFVADVKPDLPSTSFFVTFKPGSRISLESMKNKVEGAGFFVGEMTATMSVSKVMVEKDFHYELNGDQYHFTETEKRTLNGEVKLKILDKGFVTTKEYKTLSKKITADCYKSGKTASCCKAAAGRVYHVSIAA